jgi:hypothetical protein
MRKQVLSEILEYAKNGMADGLKRKYRPEPEPEELPVEAAPEVPAPAPTPEPEDDGVEALESLDDATIQQLLGE